jgi:hypothetical protein
MREQRDATAGEALKSRLLSGGAYVSHQMCGKVDESRLRRAFRTKPPQTFGSASRLPNRHHCDWTRLGSFGLLARVVWRRC